MRNSDTRGVSDAVGFVLIFGLIMTSIGLIYTTGFENIRETRSLEERSNVERAYDILADNIADVVRGDSPARSTQLKLGSNELVSSDPVTITIRDVGSSTDIVNETVYPLEYIVSSSGDSVLYVNGATIRNTRGGATMMQQPPFVADDPDNPTAVIIPVIRTQPVKSGVIGVSGGTVNVRTTSVGEIDQSFQPSGNIEFIIETPRTGAWERYCNSPSNPWTTASKVDGTRVTCELRNPSSVNTAYVQYEYIDVELTT